MSTRTGVLAVWSVLGVLALAMVVAARVSKGRFPGAVDVLGRATVRPWARALLVVGWMWLGWHAFAR